jgi:hypothetical protein
MNKMWVVTGLSVILGFSILAGPAFSGERSDDPLGVAVSPQTLILGSVQGSVSAHTDIPFSSVDKSQPVTLNGVLAYYLKADACGNLVAKFRELEIKAIVEPPSAVMTLEGYLNDGTPFSGSDTVQVIISPSS